MPDLTIIAREKTTRRPVRGASVVLDGHCRQVTDTVGVVRFPRPGLPPEGQPHVILVFRGMDYKPLILTFPPSRLLVEDRFEVELDAQPPPPERGIGWGLTAIGADCPVPPGIESVRVGIIDTGVDWHHPCLRVVGGCSTHGTAYRESHSHRPISPHGTFAAGLVSGQRINGQGIVGVAPGASLFDLRVFDAAGIAATKDAIVRAVEWAIENRLEILHVGLGSQSASLVEERTWLRARDAGIVVVAPAGNTCDDDRGVMYPAAYGTTICVGACGRHVDIADDEQPAVSDDGSWFLPAFSRCGPEVDLVGPGVAVCSIMPGLPGGKVLYDHCSGTSEAACFVTGAVVRLLAEQPELRAARSAQTPELVRGILRSRARALGIPGTGAGMLRVRESEEGARRLNTLGVH